MENKHIMFFRRRSDSVRAKCACVRPDKAAKSIVQAITYQRGC
jgi:hypothetical protein